MKTRNDFVSNSSSSSFIITTKVKQTELFDHIVEKAHAVEKDELDFYWNGDYDQLNRKFLEDNFNNYVQLVIGDFHVIGDKDTAWLEECEEAVKNRKSLAQVIVDVDDVGKFVKDGKILVEYEDLFEKGKCPDFVYPLYKVFEITQDSIDFTRWLMTKCATEANSPEYRELKEFYRNELTDKMKNYTEKIPKPLFDKWKLLSDRCNGLLECPKATRYVKNEGDKYAHAETYPLSELLDEYERRLKDGNRIYRLCAGYSGEGTDWDSYIWTSKSKFGNDEIKFECDMWW